MSDKPTGNFRLCMTCMMHKPTFTTDYDSQADHLPKPTGYKEGDELMVECCSKCSRMIKVRKRV